MFRPRVALLCLLLFVCAARPASAQSLAPVLLTEEGTDGAAAVESVTRARDPFPVTQPVAFGPEARTRDRLDGGGAVGSLFGEEHGGERLRGSGQRGA